jgi:hypothetical protein
MKFVLLVYQGSTPVPSSDRWQALSEAKQKAIYTEYAELNKTEGLAPGLPLGLPDAARTVQVRDGKTHVKNGTYAHVALNATTPPSCAGRRINRSNELGQIAIRVVEGCMRSR